MEQTNSTKFHYYIIITNRENSTFNFTDSYFNRIDDRLLQSTPFFELISHLPYDIKEVNSSWITSSNKYVKEFYYIRFIQESNVDELFLSAIKNNSFGCIFILKELSLNSIAITKLIDHSKMPIVSLVDSYHPSIITLTRENTPKVALKIIQHYINVLNNLTNNNINSPFNSKGNTTIFNSLKEIDLKYLNPLTSTIDRIRGLYGFQRKNLTQRNKKPTDSQNLDVREKEADILIIKYFKRIIAEKYILLELGYIEEESFDFEDEFELQQFDITKEELLKLFTTPTSFLYEILVNKVLKKFHVLNFKTNLTLCIPSINNISVEKISDSYGLISKNYTEKYGFLEKSIYKEIIDYLVDSENYYFGVAWEKKLLNHKFESLSSHLNSIQPKTTSEIQNLICSIEAIKEQFPILVNERGKEIDFLSKMYVFFTLAQRNPYIRLRPISFKHIHSMMKTYEVTSYFENLAELNSLFDTFNNQFKNSVPQELIDLLFKHTHSITFITDLPIEWIKLNGYPINLSKKINRIPITPGNNIINHYNIISDGRTILKSQSTKVLLIDAIANDDSLKPYVLILNEQLKSLFNLSNIEFIYKKVNTKSDYIATINTIRPGILIHYGHGEYNDTDFGILIIGQEKIFAHELTQNLTWKIPFVILGSCESNFIKSSHLNIANMFLASGSTAVIGSYFYIEASYTSLFIINLMKHLVFSFKTEIEFRDFGDLIQMSHRSLYLVESMISLKNRIEDQQIHLSSKSKTILDNALKEYFKISFEKKLSLQDSYLLDKDIFKIIFSSCPILLKEYEYLVSNETILYHSRFFSTLGSPDLLEIEKDQDLIHINDLHEQIYDYSK
ncbi:hypothetical protein [Solibacillus sp. FSL K6-4121]|uniref:hypothetical protein n=1 Tax=Solibacillus sp. FSL K6-4121 TaxID=2921505 RepID=UPI0030F6C9A1